MLKKIIVLIFMSMVSIGSINVSAKSSEPVKDITISLTATSNASDKEALVQGVYISKEKKGVADVSQNTNRNEPMLPSIWLLGVALFGFLMLSNRSGV